MDFTIPTINILAFNVAYLTLSCETHGLILYVYLLFLKKMFCNFDYFLNQHSQDYIMFIYHDDTVKIGVTYVCNKNASHNDRVIKVMVELKHTIK